MLPSELEPTASQKVVETHDTPLSQLTLEGRGSCDQVEPFHESAAPEPEVLPPTASQELAETHDTPER